MTNFSINFSNPWLLLLLIPAVGLTLLPYFRVKKKYRRTRNRIVSITLHMIIMVLSITVLAGINFSYDIPNRENEVILLVDTSFSGDETEDAKNEFIETVIDSSNSLFKIGVVTFGYDQVYAVKLTDNNKSIYDQYLRSRRPDNSATDIASALTYASTLFSNPESARIVLISDGVETDGSATGVIRNIASKGIKVDTVFFPNPSVEEKKEVQLVGVITPDQNIRTNEKFNLELKLQSTYEGKVNVKLYDNAKLLTETTTSIVANPTEIQTVNVEAQLALPGLHRFTFEIESVGNEDLLVNNSYAAYIDLEVFDQILIIETIEEESSSIREMLHDDLNVKVLNTNSPDTLPKSLDQLRAYDEVILLNVANGDLPNGFVDDILYPYVHDIGGGLFTVCGNKIDENPSDEKWEANAYTREDMYGTTYQKMLPVEIVNYTPPVAVMIIIDRSGSMYTPDAGTPYEQSPLYAAQQGAEACLDALNDRDYVGIMTLEDKYSEEIQLTPRTQRDVLIDTIWNIPKEGGGTIFSYALEYAGRALTACTMVEKRHIILVTDGMPADPIEEYGVWVEDNKNKGITMSIVGIGVEGEAKDSMLEIVKLAGGTEKNLHTTDPSRVATEMREDLMVDEIKAVNYKTFVPRISMTTAITEGIAQAEIPTLDGFYGVKAKEEADVVLMGEYTPLYAQWKYGEGMVGSFMCDLNGTWSDEFISSTIGSEIVNNIVTALFPTKSVRPDDIDCDLIEDNYTSQLKIYTELQEGDKIEVQVTSPPSENSAEETVRIIEPTTSVTQREIVITQPGVHEILIKKTDAEGNVTTTKTYKIFSYSQEYNVFNDEEACATFMADLAENGRGLVIKDPYQVFENVVKYLHRIYDPRILFMILALVLFLLDIAVRKFKFKWPHEIVRDYKAKKELGKK